MLKNVVKRVDNMYEMKGPSAERQKLKKSQTETLEFLKYNIEGEEFFKKFFPKLINRNDWYI